MIPSNPPFVKSFSDFFIGFFAQLFKSPGGYGVYFPPYAEKGLPETKTAEATVCIGETSLVCGYSAVWAGAISSSMYASK